MKELKRRVTRLVNSVEVYDYCFSACTCVDSCSFNCTGLSTKILYNYDNRDADMDHDSNVG